MRGPLLAKPLDMPSSSRPATGKTRQKSKRQALNAASFYVPTLPGLPAASTLKLYAGHIPTAPASDPESDSHLFFFLARNRHIAERERLVIWMNGGPGCSSFDGALMEIGPVRLEKDADGAITLHEVEGAWNEYANVLFLDQPAGTGYSYVGTNHYVHDLTVAADHVVDFLRQFYQIFPEYVKMDTYISGESYAGQYIPYVADAITKTNEISTPLKGLLIGNGWIDPWNQYPAYLDFAMQNSIVTKESTSYQKLQASNEHCNASMTNQGKDKMGVHDGVCERILGEILESTVQVVNGQKFCINTYDIRLTDRHPACGMNWPPDLPSLYDYLPRDDVKAAFHASAKEGGWVECSGPVGGNFQTPNAKPSISLFPSLLEKMPILLFAGEQDLICNWLGIQRAADDLTWNGRRGFGDSSALDWFVNGELAGSWQTARNLTVVKVANASHMVPFDRLVTTHDMLLRFMSTDFISAAGSAAKVPSRIGSEQEAVIGETHPNGTALDSKVDAGETLSAESNVESASAYYNAGSAAILILLLFAVGGMFFCLRARTRRFMEQEPELGLGLGPSPPGTPKGRRSTHRRGISSISSKTSQMSARKYSRDMKRAQDMNDPHEMDELVHNTDYTEEKEYENEKGYAVPHEELFTLDDGTDLEDDDNSDGMDIGKS